MEDTAYEVDRSVAAFKKISGSDSPATYYGDSTEFGKDPIENGKARAAK